MLRSVSLATYLLPIGLGVFATAFALKGVGKRHWGNVGLATGWLLLAGFWLAVAETRLSQHRPFLGGTALVAAGIFVYVATLSARGRSPMHRLSRSFFVMGGLYVPFQLVEPVHRFVVELVTIATDLGLDALGYVSLVEVGTQGHSSDIVVTGGPGTDPVTMSIFSACTGISAIALFAGLIAIADCSPRRRVAGILVFTPVIFGLNVVRNVFTIVAYREHSFAFLAGLEIPFITLGNSPQLSYLVAEQVVAPIYIVVGTLIAYKLLTAEYPSIDRTFRHVVEAMTADGRRVVSQLESRGWTR